MNNMTITIEQADNGWVITTSAYGESDRKMRIAQESSEIPFLIGKALSDFVGTPYEEPTEEAPFTSREDVSAAVKAIVTKKPELRPELIDALKTVGGTSKIAEVPENKLAALLERVKEIANASA